MKQHHLESRPDTIYFYLMDKIEEITEGTKQYYESLDEMFQTSGWRIYIDDAKEKLENLKNQALSSADSSDSSKNIWAYRARINMLKTLIDFEKNAKEAQKDFEANLESGQFQEEIFEENQEEYEQRFEEEGWDEGIHE